MPKLTPKTNPKCPHCNYLSIKNGTRKVKLRYYQRYQCKSCNHYFSEQTPPQKSKTYNLITILNTISNYNLGKPLRNQNIPKSTIHNWIKTFKLPLHRLRKSITKNPIIKKQFIHHQQPFLYQYHNLKLEFTKKFPTLISYLKEINKSLPNKIFQNSERISKIAKQSKETPTMAGGAGDVPYGVPHRFSEGKPRPIVVGVSLKSKQNYAVELAKLAASITKDNKKRHEIIENFMLINDTATIAIEIPVYMDNLTGHIDILQIRYHKIYILDYKPEPINQKQTINQLILYRKALSKRTNIKKHKFKLAFFNDKGYYEIN